MKSRKWGDQSPPGEAPGLRAQCMPPAHIFLGLQSEAAWKGPSRMLEEGRAEERSRPGGPSRFLKLF